jgi:membrane protein DedA with SNARE-associated domain
VNDIDCFIVLFHPESATIDCLNMLALLSIDTIRSWITPETWWTSAFVSFALLFACGLGLPLPEDIPLILTGAFLVQGDNLWEKWLIVGGLNWLGIIGGDICLYCLARRYGMKITRVPLIGKHVTLSRIGRVQGWFEKYGVGVVAVGRLFAGVRGAMVITAGTIRYSFIKFLLADGLAAIVSGGIFMFLGHWVGKNINDQVIEEFKHWFVIGGIVIACFFMAYLVWHHKKHKRHGGSPTQATKVL